MNPRHSIVILDSDQSVVDLLLNLLKSDTYEPHGFTSPEKAWEWLKNNKTDLVISDIRMMGVNVLTMIQKVSAMPHPPPVILISGKEKVGCTVEALRNGAYSLLEKPLDMNSLLTLISEALKKGEAKPHSNLFKHMQSVRDTDPADRAIFLTDTMRTATELAGTAARSDSTILLLGESGVGKEVLADFVHSHSPRAKQAIIKVNCGAFPEHLIESELFGHEKGAFTGADRRRTGLFENAHKGTLFLDEIGDLPLNLQVKLLRAIQEKVITRVGANEAIPVDFRLICASHRDMEEMVKVGKFREDLFYRINVIPIQIPALRERKVEIPMLASHFLKTLGARLNEGDKEFSPEALLCLCNFNWPGNIRQLRNAVEFSLVMSKNQRIQIDDLPSTLRNLEPVVPELKAYITEHLSSSDSHIIPKNAKLPPSKCFQEKVLWYERSLLHSALERLDWNVISVSDELKIPRSTVYQKIREFGLKQEPALAGSV